MSTPVSLKEYFAVEGSRFSQEDARAIGPVLEHLAHRGQGKATEMDIIHAASDPRSPLHRHFEWDNHEAARQWRKQQAREMVSAIAVKVSGENGNHPGHWRARSGAAREAATNHAGGRDADASRSPSVLRRAFPFAAAPRVRARSAGDRSGRPPAAGLRGPGQLADGIRAGVEFG